jgi:hypothetical protein
MDHLMVKESTFQSSLEKIVQDSQTFLKEENWLDPATGGPAVELIEPLIEPFRGNDKGILPRNLQKAIDLGSSTGPAFETLGNIQAALDCYRLGQYQYRENTPLYPSAMREETVRLMSRDDAATQQLWTAVCADRIGSQERAHQLYIWVAENRTLTEDEFKYFLDGQPSVIWERLPFKAYALACLGKWKEALAVADRCQEVVDSDADAQTSQSYRNPLQVLRMVQALTNYKLGPTPELLQKAREALDPQAVASRVHPSHLYSLYYLNNLRSRHPEIIDSAQNKLTSAERGRQGAQACVEWMAEGGEKLDFTPESLALLDKTIHEIFATLKDQSQKVRAIMLWGSYLGEVTRRELAGGQWRFTEEFWDSSLYWDMGEIDFNMWIFRYLHQYLHGEIQKTLFQAWQETEQDYQTY